MAVQQKTQQNSRPDLKALGIRSPMEVIDILALLKIDGEPVINDDREILDPNLKAKAVLAYFHRKFNVKPNELPYLASVIKKDLKNKRNGRRAS